MKAPAAHTNSQRQLDWWAKDAVVYFIGAGSLGAPIAVKIGVSAWATVKRRLSSIQSSNHEPLELMGVIPFRGMQNPMQAAEIREWELHRLFATLQRTNPGQCGYEWFTASDDLRTFIDRETQKPETFGFPRSVRIK